MKGGGHILNSMIIERDFSIEEFIKKLNDPRIGAIVSYLGLVKDKDNKIKGMKVDVSNETAEEIEDLKKEALEDFDIEKVEIVLRKGLLKIGDNILIILIGAKHRKDAFRACEYLIDKLKMSKTIKMREIKAG